MLSEAFEKRILELEKRYQIKLYGKTGWVPGTQLCRVLKEKDGDGWGWCLAIGLMSSPKLFFSGDGIEEVLAKAEKNLEKRMEEKWDENSDFIDLIEEELG